MYTPDSLIFDMDGTLWDAVDSYCAVWVATARELGLRLDIARDRLVPLMGRPLESIYREIVGDACDSPGRFMEALARNEERMMPRLGGRLYPDVETTLRALRDRGVRLFMVSNCSATGLDTFLSYTGLRAYFTDWLSMGATGVDKDVNIRTLVGRYNLERAAYVGDVQRDADHAHAAGVPIIWARYGFGRVSDADYTIHTFADLLELYGTEI